MFYTVYKTTHLESGKIYVGMHTTAKAGDSYLGSGTLISHAIKKYGRAAFSKEVLFVFDNPEEMTAKEKELVTAEFVSRDDTYNLNVGGDGGWFRANQTLTREARQIISQAGVAGQQRVARDPERLTRRREAGTRLANQLHAEGRTRHDGFKGHTHSEAAKANMREKLSDQRKGDDNPAAKLTAEKVREARALFAPSSRIFGIAALARRFEVSRGTMADALSGATWGHIK